MSEQRKPKDLYGLFCSFFLERNQREVIYHVLIWFFFWFLLQACWFGEFNSLREQSDYILTPGKISVSKKPLWIPPSLESEAILANTRLQERSSLSLLDKNLGADLVFGFQNHPWIRNVKSITFAYPASVYADLEYREPIAIVNTSSSVKDGVQSLSFYQIDADTILLPTDYLTVLFSSDTKAADKYIVIQGIDSTPRGGYGESWDDPILEEAALLAEFLKNDFQHLGIRKIIISETEEETALPLEERSATRKYTLETVQGKKIIWGSFPMSEVRHARIEKRVDYQSVKESAFKKEEPKLALLNESARSEPLDTLEPDKFPANLSQFD